MRLSASPIINFCDINDFTFGNQWIVRDGDPITLYFQLIDLDQNNLRYLPGIGVSNQPYSVQVTFPSIDDTKVVTATAIQVDPADNSIWKIVLGPSQQVNTGNVQFAVFEGSSIRRFNVMNMLNVEFLNNGSC